MRLILVTGGARGGKSRYADGRARELGGDDVTYVATATAGDDEMRLRIARHRRERPSAWATIEAPSRAGAAVRSAPTDIVVLDCITMLTANALGPPEPRDEAAAVERMLAEVDDVLDAARRRAGTLIIVTNEVGFGVHPPTALGCWFQNGLGRVNQRLAAEADEVVLMVSGVPLTVKPQGVVK
jgi:adenosylcobinamide kinase / adenosylcobinamide-phosphate guanylyltransferase